MRRRLQIRALWPLAIALGAFLFFAGRTGVEAEMVVEEAQNVPTERVIANLERRLAGDPSDVSNWINLARAHAVAWATKSGTQPVLTQAYGSHHVGDPAGNVPNGSFQHVRIVPTNDPEMLKAAREHLVHAITAYREALRRDASNVIARLGLAWCQDQAGERPQAIAGYRAVLKTVWPSDSASPGLLLGGPAPTTAEVAGYLLRLLDPVTDAAEIATLKDHLNELDRLPRLITPILVPLDDDATLSDLIDPQAQVWFDADGSGSPRRWSWIRPRAGWLVFDRSGQGRISSALQWFGSVTFWLFWSNGYEPLRSLDDNGDGRLTGRELDGVAVWSDKNANGVSERGEVRSAASLGITALSCSYVRLDDDPALAAWSPTGVTLANGRTRSTYDVLLYPR